MTNLFFLSTFLYTLLLSTTIQQEAPIFVYSHFRHGARGPLRLNSDGVDYFGHKWSSLGELTGVGMRMHYILGYRTHLKYKQFLSSTYDPRELYVYSSDVNRTIISAASHLQGLYPESTGPVLTEEQLKYANMTPIEMQQEIADIIVALGNLSLPHQINTIPIHVFHTDEKRFLLHEEGVCLTMTETMKQNEKRLNVIKEVVDNFNKAYKDKLELFVKGDDVDFNSIRFINSVTDQFIADYYDGRDLSFLESEYGINVEQFLNDSLKIFSTYFEHFTFGDDELELASMSMTPVFKEMLELMKNRVNGDMFGTTADIAYNDYSKPKMVLISGHDSSTGASELFMKKIFNLTHEFIVPVFATNSMFEIHRNATKPESYNDYIVNYYFNDQLLATFNFANFVETITDNLWSEEEIEDYCHIGNYKEREEERKLYIATIVLGSFCVTLLIIAFVIWGLIYKRKRGLNREAQSAEPLMKGE